MLCEGGCGIPVQKGRRYARGHAPAHLQAKQGGTQGRGCPPRRLCSCECGEEFQPGAWTTHRILGHPKGFTYPCEVCGEEMRVKPSEVSGKNPNRSRRRHKQCYIETKLKTEESGLVRWLKSHPEEAAAHSAAAARRGHDRMDVDAAPVRHALAAKGVDYKDVARDLGISKAWALKLVKQCVGSAPRMRREMAERLLRYAAGLPYLPTKQQRVAAARKDMAWRRARDRVGKSNRQPSIVAPGLGHDLRVNTAHLKKKNKSDWFRP